MTYSATSNARRLARAAKADSPRAATALYRRAKKQAQKTRKPA